MNEEFDKEYLEYTYITDAKEASEFMGFGDYLSLVYTTTGNSKRLLTIAEIEAIQCLTDHYEA